MPFPGLPTQVEKEVRVADVKLVCFRCRKVSTVLPSVSLVDVDAENWDTITPHLLELGWAIRVDPVLLRRYSVCPECLKKEEEQYPLIPKVVSAASVRTEVCPKCGSEDIKRLYQTGRNWRELLPIEHIRCTCTICEYAFARRPLDAADVKDTDPSAHHQV